MKWYFKAIKKYAQFEGRASRKEFWMFFLFNILFAVSAMILDIVLGTDFKNSDGGFSSYGYILDIYFLATLLPFLAVCSRRFQDMGKSGWFLLINLVPLGTPFMFIWFCRDGNSGKNEYGLDPKSPPQSIAP